MRLLRDGGWGSGGRQDGFAGIAVFRVCAGVARTDVGQGAGSGLGGCGASVQFEPPEVAGTCPFCAAAIVAQPKGADPLVAPHGVLPFQLSRDGGNRAVSEWLKGLWFAPNGLKDLARTEALQGVYLPFWTFDASTESDYRGERGTRLGDRDLHDGREKQ